MRAGVTLSLLLLLASCSGCGEQPSRIPDWGTLQDRPAYPGQCTSLLMTGFFNLWEAENPQDDMYQVRLAFDRLDIVWEDDIFPATYGDYWLEGVTEWPGSEGGSRGRIRVAAYHETVSKTALAHELAHLTLWVARGDPVADHKWGKSVEDIISLARHAASNCGVSQ